MTTSEDLTSSPFEASFSVTSAVPLRRANPSLTFWSLHFPEQNTNQTWQILCNCANQHWEQANDGGKRGKKQQLRRKKLVQRRVAKLTCTHVYLNMKTRQKKSDIPFFFFLCIFSSFCLKNGGVSLGSGEQNLASTRIFGKLHIHRENYGTDYMCSYICLLSMLLLTESLLQLTDEQCYEDLPPCHGELVHSFCAYKH